MRKRTTLAATLGAAALGAGGGAATYAALGSGSAKQAAPQVTVTSSRPAATSTPLSITDIYKHTYKGVVEITVSSAAPQSPFGDGAPTQQAQGSGFVYDGNGGHHHEPARRRGRPDGLGALLERRHLQGDRRGQ